MARTRLITRPVEPDDWDALESLFGQKGACGGCWCMLPRLSRSEFEAGKGDGNRRALQRLVQSGEQPGIMAWEGDAPVGWCAVAPRTVYPTLARSRILKPVDDRPVWSIVCLFVARSHRRRGVSRALIDGAAAFARGQGATLIEAYPVEPKQDRMPDAFAWTGVASAYLACGFKEVERRSQTRPIMRRTLRLKRG